MVVHHTSGPAIATNFHDVGNVSSNLHGSDDVGVNTNYSIQLGGEDNISNSLLNSSQHNVN